MGVVYQAEDTRLHRPVALKFLPLHLAAHLDAKQRLLDEARASAALDHPNIGVIHEIGETPEGQPFIAMAYYEGDTLTERIRRERLPVAEAARLIGQVARGLRAAHQHGRVHCDLKPSNILVTANGLEPRDGSVVKIVDFGIARLLRGEFEASAAPAGTIAYMAPEQTRGEAVGVRTDLWSLGVVLYEMLTGRRPFEAATDRELVQAIRQVEPEPVENVRPDVPPALEQIIRKSLRKDAHERYPDAEAFLADLERFETGRSNRQRRNRGSSAKERLSAAGRLAVLPLNNLSPDPSDEYLALSLTDELISRLSKLSGLRVIGRTSSMRYAATQKRIAEIGMDLSVPVILSGSLRKQGDSLRITIDLVETQTEELLWSEAYDGKTGDVLTVPRDIAEKVAEALQVQLRSGEHEQLLKTGTWDREAYESYLQGRYFVDRFDEASATSARDHFQRALDLDPAFAEAWTGLADTYKVFDYLSMLAPKEAAARSRAAAERALELDPDLAGAHTSLATVLADYYWDWEAAAHHYRRAIDLNPGYPTGHQLYAEYLRDMGCFDEAMKEIRKAQDLDPLSPFYQLVEGVVLMAARRTAEASALYERLVATHPNYPAGYLYLGLAYVHEGRYEATLATMDQADPQRSFPDALAIRGMALVGLKRTTEAHMVLDELHKLSERRYVSPFHWASVHMALGETERALDLLEQGTEEHSWFVRLLRIEPGFDLVCSHPRFTKILEKVGLDTWPRRPERL
jgi:non-specific serine/threonine protein kinase